MTTRAKDSSLVLPGLFVVPVAKIPTPEPPIAPSSSLQARHCSSMGAQKIAPSRESLWKSMLNFYAQRPCTDAEIAEALGVAPSTISARRNELIALGKVEDAHATKKNRHTGVSNSLWGLTEKGRQ